MRCCILVFVFSSLPSLLVINNSCQVTRWSFDLCRSETRSRKGEEDSLIQIEKNERHGFRWWKKNWSVRKPNTVDDDGDDTWIVAGSGWMEEGKEKKVISILPFQSILLLFNVKSTSNWAVDEKDTRPLQKPSFQESEMVKQVTSSDWLHLETAPFQVPSNSLSLSFSLSLSRE